MTAMRPSVMRTIVLLPVAAFAIADMATAQTRRSTLEPGVSYRAGGQTSLVDYRRPSAASCRESCVQNLRCRHWVYITADAPQANVRNACVLYASPPVFTPIKAYARGWIVGGRIVTRLERRRSSTYEPGILYARRNQTNGYRFLENTVVQRCRDTCLEDARCRHWSYITANGPEKARNSCMLYDTAPVRQIVHERYRSAVISGRVSPR